MSVRLERVGDVAVVIVDGLPEGKKVLELDAVLEELVHIKGQKIILDLEHANLNHELIQTIADACAVTRKHGTQIVFCGVRRVGCDLGWDSLKKHDAPKFLDTRDEALEALREA